MDTRSGLLLASGSVAAGVHAGLAPEHLHEWAPLGASFVAAAVVAGGLATAVAVGPDRPWPAPTLVLVLTGLVGAYVLTRIMALPPLDPDRESLDTIGLVTVAAEFAGVAAGLRLVLSQGGTR